MKFKNETIDRLALSIPEAAQSLGVSENVLREVIRSTPDFPILQISIGRRIIPVDALREWLSKQTYANRT